MTSPTTDTRSRSRTITSGEAIHGLAATADVVVANLPDSALTAMGLDYAALLAVTPDIILSSVSAFGAGGPYSEKVGFDGIGQPLFERWTTLMGEAHWLEDPRFKDDISRGDHGDVISERMASWCAARTTDQALAALENARLPAGPVYTPQETLDDPHVQAAGFLKAVGVPGSPTSAPVADTPFSLSETQTGVRQRAPLLGEHTDQILTELGYKPSEIAALRAARVV